MRRLVAILLIVGLIGVAGYYAYRSLVPSLVADALVSESVPAYIPKRLQHKVEEIRKPVNRGTEAMLQEMHAHDIPLEDVMDAVDGLTEERAYAFLDKLNTAKPQTTDEVFEMAKEHFKVDFEIEVFRKSFNEHFEMNQIEDAIAFANMNRKSNDVNFNTAKAILKKILLEKEAESKNASSAR